MTDGSVPSQPTDPPLEPMAHTVKWFESGPGPIIGDRQLATLMVRVGMAGNALAASRANAVSIGDAEGSAVRMRNLLCSLVHTASLINESIKLASSGMPTLRELALEFRTDEDFRPFVGRVSQLCAGKHPASDLLRRARNKLGFHWDADIIEESLFEFTRNAKLVWVEADTAVNVTHRLASDVLAHAMFPEASAKQASDEAQSLVDAAMNDLDQAGRLIHEFFTAAVFGYMRRIRAAAREKEA